MEQIAIAYLSSASFFDGISNMRITCILMAMDGLQKETFEVLSHATIPALKEIICKAFGIEVKDQRLLYLGNRWMTNYHCTTTKLPSVRLFRLVHLY